MKAIKKIIAIVLVLVTVFATAAFAENETEANTAAAASYLYATGDVNLRADAGKGNKIITVIKKGATVTKLGSKTAADGTVWYQVKTKDGKIGYASSKYLTKNQPAIGNVKTTANLHVRAEANSKSKILGTLAKGKTVKYIATYKNAAGTTWYKISAGTLTGWVSGNYVTIVK